MVILVEKGWRGIDAERWGFELVESIEDKIVEHVLKEEIVVALYSGAYERYPNLVYRIRSAGGNPYLYEPVSDRHGETLGSSLLPYYLKIKEEQLYKSKPWKTPYRISLKKRVSRRTLLRSPIAAIREYNGAPYLRDASLCESISRCSLCIEACPKQALSGKPPIVDPAACIGCGICMGQCPFDIIAMPSWSTDKIVGTVRRLKQITGRISVLIAARGEADIVDTLLEAIPAPVVVDFVDKMEWVLERIIIELLLNGANQIIIYNPASRYTGLNETTPHLLEIDGKSLPVYYITSYTDLQGLGRAIEKGAREFNPQGIRVDTRLPVRGILHVEDSCTMCGACVDACPNNALVVEEGGGRIALQYYHDKCVGCKICEKVCPHGSIKVYYRVDSSLFAKKTLLNSDEMAKCKRCGRPIGPASKLRQLEQALRLRGHSDVVVDSLWLCDECKEEIQSEIYYSYLKSKTSSKQ